MDFFKDWTFTVDVERVIEPYFMRTDTLKVKGIIISKIGMREMSVVGKKGSIGIKLDFCGKIIMLE